MLTQRQLLRLCLLAFLLLPAPALSHTGGEHAPSGPTPSTVVPQEGGAIGLEERLGAKIPLDVSFRDEKGQPVRLADIVTGPTIVLPVYFGCSNVCNYLQGGLARVLPAVKFKPGTEYRVISLSIDENETPDLASRFRTTYLGSMGGSFPQEGWRFLTGELPSIRKVTDAAGYRFRRQGHDFIHPLASFVVTGDGRIVRYLYGTNFLAKDLTLALMEAQRGEVGVTIRKVVGYCFRFDPASKSYEFNLLRVSATVVILCCGGFLAYLILGGAKRKPNYPGGK